MNDRLIPFLYEVALLACHSEWSDSERKNLAVAYVHTELVSGQGSAKIWVQPEIKISV